MKRKTELTGTVIYPNDPAYEEARKNWNPFTDAFPIVFVFAHQTKDVIMPLNGHVKIKYLYVCVVEDMP